MTIPSQYQPPSPPAPSPSGTGGGGSRPPTPVGANPTALVGAIPVNGTAPTFMTSDSAPALNTTGVVAGSYTNANLTVDTNGRLTAASNGSSGSPGGSSGQIQYNNAGSFGGFTASGDATINTGTGVVTLANTAVTPGSYTNASITVDSKGRLTAASNGTAPTNWFPLVNGAEPPAFITDGAGVLIAVAYTP